MKINFEADLSRYDKYLKHLTLKNLVRAIWYSLTFLTFVGCLFLAAIIWNVNAFLIAPVVQSMYSDNISIPTYIVTLINCTEIFATLSMALAVALALVVIILASNFWLDKLKDYIRK